MLKETPVVTCFLRHRGEVLLLKRSDAVGSYVGRWGAPAGHVEGDPNATARKEIDEEAGLSDAVDVVRRGMSFSAEDEEQETRWIIHPYLFDCRNRDVRLNRESTEATWVPPTELLRRETVPNLWTAYAHVAPTVETIRNDRTHGAAYLSLRTLEVLRDEAGHLAWQESRQGEIDAEKTWQRIEALARQLLEVRPSMAALRNRVNRAMHACYAKRSAETAEHAAREGIARALAADDRAAEQAAILIAGKRVLTLSRSGTVEAALQQADPAPRVFVAASHPGDEGIGVAERLDDASLDVTLLPDAAMAHAISEEHIDLILTGADTVLPSGAVVNKTGTRLAALAAREAGIPFYAACATDKIRPDEQADLEEGPPAQVYAGDAPLRVLNPTFEVMPTDLVTSLVTERGLLKPDAIGKVADELRALTGWQDKEERMK